MRASIGLTSSLVSDTSSNFVRVIKTIKQTSENTLSYKDSVNNLYKQDGVMWVFRGLKTKILTNGLNGILFSITWKYYQDIMLNN